MRGKNKERDGLVNAIQCVEKCKGFRDLEFCEVFSRNCEPHRVL